jgi:hypothetical protein
LIKLDKKNFINQNFTYLINDALNLIFCITDNYSDSSILDIIEYGIIKDLNDLYLFTENEIKEKIDNFFRIFFCLNRNLLFKKLNYFNNLLESERFFDLLLQSYFPQLNKSDLNVNLTQKISNFVEDLVSKEYFNENENENFVNDYPKIYEFLTLLKENCVLFSNNINEWKKDKIFLNDFYDL